MQHTTIILSLFRLDQGNLITECTVCGVAETFTVSIWGRCESSFIWVYSYIWLKICLENSLNLILYIFRYESATNSICLF